MRALLRSVSAALFVLSLAAMLTVLVADATSALALTPLHREAGALSFALIGASYLILQFSLPAPWNKKLKPLLLGLGFLFWGSAQLLPNNIFVTVMDTAVVLIFVMDLGLIILEHLRSR